MIASLEVLEATLLALPSSDRARLAERLIASLDEDAEIDTAWRVEVERRVTELTNGTAELYSLNEVLDEIDREL